MHPAIPLCVLSVLILGAGTVLPPQRTSTAKDAESLRSFFQQLRLQDAQKPLPTHEELLKVKDPIGAIPAADLSAVLPDISQALAHPDDRVKIYAASALLAVSLRPDSNIILATYVDQILSLLESNDGRLQASPAMIFFNWKSRPPSEALASLVSFVHRRDRESQAQVAAIFLLARMDANNPKTLEAINGFLHRGAEPRTRVDALNAVGTPEVGASILTGTVRGFFQHADAGVRLAAIEATRRMGRQAVKEAKFALQKLAVQEDELPVVRKAARDALLSLETK